MMDYLPSELYKYIFDVRDKSDWNKEEFKHFPELQWLIENNIHSNGLNEKNLIKIFEKGYLKLLRLVDIIYYREVSHVECFHTCATYGHLDCIKYLHEERGWDLENGICSCAAYNGHYDCLKYTYEKQGYWDDVSYYNGTIYVVALYGGNLKCLQYIHEQGCRLDTWTFICNDMHFMKFEGNYGSFTPVNK